MEFASRARRLFRAAAGCVAVCLISSFSTQSLAQDRTATSKDASQSEARFDLVLRNVNIATALDKLVEVTGMSLLYDSEELGTANITCVGKEQTAEEVLRCVVADARLDFYRLSSGTYVIVPLANRPPDKGSLAGLVVDMETGEPLPYANILIADASNGVSANDAGQFSLGPIAAGEYQLVASYVGYEQYSDTLIVPANTTTRRRIELRPEAVRVMPIVINGLQRQLSATLVSGELQDQTLRSGGNRVDILRLAAEIEGVRSGASFADLHLQGGESGEHVVLLDGAPIFEPVSLGRFLGSFSPLAVGRITVHKAGFGAQHGSRLSGVVAIDHDLADRRVDRLSVMVDPYSLNARASFSGGANAPRGLVAVRRSLWSAYQFPALASTLKRWNSSDQLLTNTILGPVGGIATATPLAHSSDLGFTDIHFASRIPVSVFSSVSVSAYYGESRVATELLSSETPEPQLTRYSLTQDSYRWTNSMAQARYEWIAGARWLGSARIRFSEHRLADSFGLVDSERLSVSGSVAQIETGLRNALQSRTPDDNTNRFTEAAFELRSTVSLSRSRQLDVGMDAVLLSNRFLQRSDFFREIDLAGTNWKFVGFANLDRKVGEQISLDLGSRLTYVPKRKTAYAEPRLSIRYDGSAPFLESYAVRLAGGVYRQFVNPLDLSSVGPSAIMPFVRVWMPTDKSMGPASSYHTALAFLAVPGNGWQVRAEGFAKWIPRSYSINYGALLNSGEPVLTSQQSFIEEGSGQTLGLSATLERSTNKFEASGSYSFESNKRTYPSRIGDNKVTAPWSEPHRFTTIFRVHPGSGISVRTRFHAVLGRSWGFRQSYYDFLAAHNSARAFPPFDLKDPESHQLEGTYQFDVGIGYDRRISTSDVRIRFDILNVLNRKNAADWSLIPDTSEPGQFETSRRSLPGIQPMLSIEISL